MKNTTYSKSGCICDHFTQLQLNTPKRKNFNDKSQMVPVRGTSNEFRTSQGTDMKRAPHQPSARLMQVTKELNWVLDVRTCATRMRSIPKTLTQPQFKRRPGQPRFLRPETLGEGRDYLHFSGRSSTGRPSSLVYRSNIISIPTINL